MTCFISGHLDISPEEFAFRYHIKINKAIKDILISW